ncbi:putative transposase [Planctomycetales bacterium]|nr:putative transposase [Planctomycetales bacterium]
MINLPIVRGNLILEDESGINLLPNVCKTWSVRGETPVLLEPLQRQNHSAMGCLILTHRLRHIRFGFSIQQEHYRTEDFIAILYDYHRKIRKQAIIVWDGLSAHYSSAEYFESFHPDWFEFYYFPSHSPELNPVESGWSVLKCSRLANNVFETSKDLSAAAYKETEKMNEDKRLLLSFFKHSQLTL